MNGPIESKGTRSADKLHIVSQRACSSVVRGSVLAKASGTQSSSIKSVRIRKCAGQGAVRKDGTLGFWDGMALMPSSWRVSGPVLLAFGAQAARA